MAGINAVGLGGLECGRGLREIVDGFICLVLSQEAKQIASTLAFLVEIDGVRFRIWVSGRSMVGLSPFSIGPQQVVGILCMADIYYEKEEKKDKIT